MTLDTAYLHGSMAAILSILQHSSCPQNIAFHFVASSNDYHLRRMIVASFPYLRFQVYHFDESAISTSIRAALDRPLNYTRTYLASLLAACVQRVVYLDSDLILVDDIAKLVATQLGHFAVLATTRARGSEAAAREPTSTAAIFSMADSLQTSTPSIAARVPNANDAHAPIRLCRQASPTKEERWGGRDLQGREEEEEEPLISR